MDKIITRQWRVLFVVFIFLVFSGPPFSFCHFLDRFAHSPITGLRLLLNASSERKNKKSNIKDRRDPSVTKL